MRKTYASGGRIVDVLGSGLEDGVEGVSRGSKYEGVVVVLAFAMTRFDRRDNGGNTMTGIWELSSDIRILSSFECAVKQLALVYANKVLLSPVR